MNQENRSQSEQAFTELLMHHQPVITAYIISLLPGASETDDVIQNTNEVLWKKRDTFTIGTNFKAWALTTARFQVMSFLQSRKKRMTIQLDESMMNLVSEAFNREEESPNIQQIQDLDECIKRLDIKDQELVLYRYWKKNSLKEYAKTTGRSVSSLKSALFRVRTTLRNCLDLKKSNQAN